MSESTVIAATVTWAICTFGFGVLLGLIIGLTLFGRPNHASPEGKEETMTRREKALLKAAMETRDAAAAMCRCLVAHNVSLSELSHEYDGFGKRLDRAIAAYREDRPK